MNSHFGFHIHHELWISCLHFRSRAILYSSLISEASSCLEPESYTSLQHAVETAWSRQEKEDLKKRLLSLKDALETRVLFAIRYVRTLLCVTFDLMSSRENLNGHSLRASARFDNLDQKTQHILSSLVDSTNITTETSQELREYMIAQTTTISQILKLILSEC
jgi:hypothetical protein